MSQHTCERLTFTSLVIWRQGMPFGTRAEKWSEQVLTKMRTNTLHSRALVDIWITTNKIIKHMVAREVHVCNPGTPNSKIKSRQSRTVLTDPLQQHGLLKICKADRIMHLIRNIQKQLHQICGPCSMVPPSSSQKSFLSCLYYCVWLLVLFCLRIKSWFHGSFSQVLMSVKL